MIFITKEVQEHFTDYMVKDSLGIIANAHAVFADKEPLKAESSPCLELARLFSIAVDFPKTGVPAVIPPHLYVQEYPDFMEKLEKDTYVSQGVIGKLFRAVKGHKETYKSQGVIGKLFRAVKGHSVNASYIKELTKEIAKESCDPDMEVDGFRNYINQAVNFKKEYDYKLGCLMDQYEIKTEAEILSGTIMGKAVKSLRKEARGWFNEKSDADYENPCEDDLDAKASAWYYVTYHPSYWGCYNEEYNWPHFLSFPWCVYDRLIAIKKRKMKMMKKRKFCMPIAIKKTKIIDIMLVAVCIYLLARGYAAISS